jgi:hypothetical protein
MPDNLPNPLKLEVKVSRTTAHALSQRDLDGVKPGGYAAILITERRHHGPRWLLLPGELLQPGNHTDAALCAVGGPVPSALENEVNRIWSDWILDETVWSRLFEQDHIKIKAGIEWCLKQHPPRVNRSIGNLRETRLADALRRFREGLDHFLSVEEGPKQEGFIHQYLLAHALEKVGYMATVNPVGVPDISGILRLAAASDLLERVMDWQPDTPEEKALKGSLEKCSAGSLEVLRKILNG